VFILATAVAVRPIQSPIEWISGAASPVLKRMRGEANHPFPSSAGVKNGLTVPPLPPMRVRGVALSNWQGQSYLCLAFLHICHRAALLLCLLTINFP
jgi:hypothetical protein